MPDGEVDARTEVVLRGGDLGLGRRHQVATRRHRPDDVRREAGVVESGADPVDREVADVLQRQLDRVEAEVGDAAGQRGQGGVGER